MPKAYAIFTECVIDPGRYAEYRAQAVEPSVKHGVKRLAISGNPELLEGEWHGPRTIILEFESLAAAHAWYYSPEYQAVIPLRQGAVEANGVIVQGFDIPANLADQRPRASPLLHPRGQSHPSATIQGMTWKPSPVDGSCAGSLIVHVIDRTATACSLDEEPDGCAGKDTTSRGQSLA